MITIDALLTTGRSALDDLEGASPTGGQVTSEIRKRTTLTPGDVVRDCGSWVVVTDVRHSGIHGITSVALLDAGGITTLRTLTCSIEVRTDARIDPDTLWKLVKLAAA